jgi:hypothetical protein
VEAVEIVAVIPVSFVLQFWNFGFRQYAPGRVSVSAPGARRFVLQIGALNSLVFLPWVRSANSSRIGRTDAVGTPEIGRRIGPLKSLRFRRMALFCPSADLPFRGW